MKDLKRLFITTLIIISCSSFLISQTLEELVVQGNQLFAEQNYTEALNIYQRAIAIDDQRMELYILRGLTFRKLENSERFLQDFKLVQQHNPILFKRYLEEKHYFPSHAFLFPIVENESSIGEDDYLKEANHIQ